QHNHPLSHTLCLLLLRPPPPSTLFPYTTLFRSDPGEVLDLNEREQCAAVPLRPVEDAVHLLARVRHLLLDADLVGVEVHQSARKDRKSTRLNSSHVSISYAVFCLKKKKICKI